MPASVSISLEEVSEEALKERIGLRKVAAAVEMYDQLLQAGKQLVHTLTIGHWSVRRLLCIILLIGRHPGLQANYL